MALRIADTALLTDSALQAYWKMDEDWTDGKSGYTLTTQNGPTFVTGKFGQAGNFVAASTTLAYIVRADCPNIRISGSQSWVCWVNQTTITSYQAPMNMSNGDGSNSAGFLTSADSSNIVYFNMPGLTTNTQVNSGSQVISTGTWFHLAGVYDSATTSLKIYINGTEGGSVTASGSKTDISSGAFALGGRGDGAAQFTNGSIDDAAIFSRALTPTEILNLVTGTAPGGGAFLQNFV